MRKSDSVKRKGAVKCLAKQYYKKNKVRNMAAMLAIILTAFLFSSITSLAFNMVSSMQLSMQMQKGSKGDGTLGYLTEEQFALLADSDFVKQAGHRRVIGYADNAVGHSVELNYADSVQQELTFCKPTSGRAPVNANEIATTDLALKALGVEPEIGAAVPVEFDIRGKVYHYDMKLSGWWEAVNDTISVAVVSEAFVEENPDVFLNTYRKDHEMSGVTFSEVVLKDKRNVQEQLVAFVESIGGNAEDMSADNFVLATANRMSQGLIQPESVLFAAVFILMFVVCGYLLIYNIFDISVMQDVRQYGLLRTIGASARQIRSIVNQQAIRLTLMGLPVGLILGYFAGWMMLPAVMGASENFWEDMVIFEGETDLQILKQKMLTGEYAIIGCFMDDLTGGPERTSLTDALQIGDSISFSKDGKIVKTCTVLAKASLVGTQRETPTTTTAQSNIGGDAPFVFLADTAFREIYDTPTLLNFAFNVEESMQPQMEKALSNYVEENPSAAYTSTKLIKEQVDSIRSMILIVGSLIGGIMAFAGLINFTNMIITNIITRRHEFATLQSIGMTERQLRRLVVYEGVYYAVGADLIGALTAVFLTLTVLKNMLNSPSMWFFSLRLTLVPAAVISVLYLILAAVIPMVALYFFHGGTVVERLRTTE
ncbi:MAG: ABC transporter permease [Marvinbryantia sp.]|jgi:ABC-type antimicrobial peptide transport system permease subunit